ncbi:MAG: S41 family peptidase [Thermodesulfobacteriota bacterium]
MNQIVQRVIVTAVFSTLLLPTALFAEISEAQQRSTYRQLETFANVLSILQENYVEEIDAHEVIEGAVNGMLLSLDPHSSYLKPEDFRDLQNETRGNFSGIGIEITIREGILTVVSPIEGTPAYRAGLKARDIIVNIEGVPTKQMSPMDAVKKLRGPKGSKVTISIHRKGWEELKDFTLVRDTIPLRSVKSFFVEPGFGYIRITNFQGQTTKDLKKALKKLAAEQPVKGLLLDLRDNPGGLLDQAVSVSDLFLGKGLVVYTKGRLKDQNMTFQAHDDAGDLNLPLVVLVNEGSASASEIVTGAIQDHKRGIIVGTKTFGKGSVQTIIPMPEGAGLRMTTARYYTPKGRSIQATGITPDVEVPLILPTEKQKANNGRHSVVREADLKNHITNGNKKKKEKEKEQEDKGKEQEIKKRLKKDNQLRSGLNILKSLRLYSEYQEKSSDS